MDQLLRTCRSQVSARVRWGGPAQGRLRAISGVTRSQHFPCSSGRKDWESGGKGLSKTPVICSFLYVLNNSSLRIMRLNSNAFLCSCHEAKPRWRSPAKYQTAWETGKRRKGVFQVQVRMAYLSSCDSTRHRLQLASSQGSLRSQVSQSFHRIPHFKVRQLTASFLSDLCRKEKQNRNWLLSYF